MRRRESSPHPGTKKNDPLGFIIIVIVVATINLLEFELAYLGRLLYHHMKLIWETFGTWTWRDDILAFKKAAGCLVQWEFLVLGLELLSCVSPPSLYSLFFSLERFLHTCVFSPRTKSSRWENSHVRWLYPYQFSPIGTTLPHPSTSEMLSSLLSFLNSGSWPSVGSDNWMHYSSTAVMVL